MNGVPHLLRRAGERALGCFHVDLNHDHRNSIFLAGSGRSGTTWLSEIINHRNEYRYIFEPFYPDRVGLCKSFRRKQYLRPEDRCEEFLEPARKIISGRVRNLWTDRFNRKLVVRRRLIKDIRANLLLGWLHDNFPRMPIVLLLRHPCAVTYSRIKLGWKDVLDDTMEQPELIEDHLSHLEKDIRNARTPFERSIFLWCIENYIPLRQLDPGAFHLVFYENLCTNPGKEVRRLYSFLGKTFNTSIYSSIGRPSSLSRRESAVVVGGHPVDSWMGSVDTSQIERSVEILSLFGLDHIYGDDPMPNPDGTRALVEDRTEERGSPGEAG
ncbi:MAG: sulfotransferase [Actinomycetota bacterium]|nr:sulfotransferase [Actinomycetota bacterium]